MTLSEELARELAVIRSAEDVVPFMTEWFSTEEAEFRLLPDDMLAIIRSSPDFREVAAGATPNRLQLAAGNDHAELIVYRAAADRRYYMLAPVRRNFATA